MQGLLSRNLLLSDMLLQGIKMKKLLTLALCTLSVSAFATIPSIEDKMPHTPRVPPLEFPN